MAQPTIRTFVAALALVAGCAGAPVPAQRLASAKAAIRSAEEVGTAGQPAG